MSDASKRDGMWPAIERSADEEFAQFVDTEGGMHLVRGMPIVQLTGCRQGTRAFTYNAYARGVIKDSTETGEPDDNQTTACTLETEWITRGERLTKHPRS